MQRLTHELIFDHVRSIYQAATGVELPDGAGSALCASPPTWEEVVARFAELDAWIRVVPPLAARVPPFSFVPPVDVAESDDEILVEAAIPGVEKSDVDARVTAAGLVISGLRRARPFGRHFLRHAEIARGPFFRMVPLSPHVAPEPVHIEVHEGLVRVRVKKLAAPPVAKA